MKSHDPIIDITNEMKAIEKEMIKIPFEKDAEYNVLYKRWLMLKSKRDALIALASTPKTSPLPQQGAGCMY